MYNGMAGKISERLNAIFKSEYGNLESKESVRDVLEAELVGNPYKMLEV